MDWTSGHRKICKLYKAYTSSTAFQALETHKKMDALLLSILVAHLCSVHDWNENISISTFQSLLRGPVEVSSPPVCPKHSISQSVIDDFYARFDNNNFSIHSHFKTYAHGIFPVASRLFNHSCMPNAAVKFIIQTHEPVQMQIVALRSISVGDEVHASIIMGSRFNTESMALDMPSIFRSSSAPDAEYSLPANIWIHMHLHFVQGHSKRRSCS